MSPPVSQSIGLESYGKIRVQSSTTKATNTPTLMHNQTQHNREQSLVPVQSCKNNVGIDYSGIAEAPPDGYVSSCCVVEITCSNIILLNVHKFSSAGTSDPVFHVFFCGRCEYRNCCVEPADRQGQPASILHTPPQFNVLRAKIEACKHAAHALTKGS